MPEGYPKPTWSKHRIATGLPVILDYKFTDITRMGAQFGGEEEEENSDY